MKTSKWKCMLYCWESFQWSTIAQKVAERKRRKNSSECEWRQIDLLILLLFCHSERFRCVNVDQDCEYACACDLKRETTSYKKMWRQEISVVPNRRNTALNSIKMNWWQTIASIYSQSNRFDKCEFLWNNIQNGVKCLFLFCHQNFFFDQFQPKLCLAIAINELSESFRIEIDVTKSNFQPNQNSREKNATLW